MLTLRSIRSATVDIHAPWSAAESVIYDRFLGDAAADAMAPLFERFVVDANVKDGEVLDVGCGGAQGLLRVARSHPQLRVCALDLSPTLVARAARRMRPLGARARAVEGSALDLPFDDGAFAAVWSMASLKHWPDRLRGLREVVRVTKPGGPFCVVEVDRGCAIDDARRFVGALPALSPWSALSLPLLRTWVLGQGWDLEEARKLCAQLNDSGDVEPSVERLKGWPHLALRGRRLR